MIRETSLGPLPADRDGVPLLLGALIATSLSLGLWAAFSCLGWLVLR